MCGHRRHHHRESTRRVAADDTRASDAERDRTVAALRAHASEGRLTIEELDERTAAALRATTRRDLAALTHDLPRAGRAPRDERAELREHVRTYLGVMLLLVAIWALTGAGYFWPVWPALGWGVAVASHASAALRGPARRPA